MRIAVFGSILLLSAVVGCGKANNQVPPSNQAATGTQAGQASATMEDSAESYADEFDPARREQELLTKLEQSPKDTTVLLALANLTQTLARTTDDEYAAFKKSAGYVHQAMEANPEIAKTDEFLQIAGEAFYNEACAFSRENQIEQSLKSLTLAVDHGWTNLSHLSNDPDLEHVRQSPLYAAFDEALQDKRRAHVEATVEALFAQTYDFAVDFDLKDCDGQPVKMKDFAGKVLLVNVWGTWCPPCRRELPDLAAAAEKYKSQGFEIVGLNTESETGDEANELIRKSKKEFGINYPCALVSEETLSQIPNLNGVPTSIFFNREGKILARVVGMIDKMTLEMIIERLLKESPAATDGAKN